MKSNKRNFLLIILVGVLAWFPTLNFWFFKAYEATWLTGLAPHNLINLIRGHGILYFLDLKIFGWNPWGWYLTSLILHIVSSLILFKVVLLISKKKTLSLISSLIFVASTSYNDVLTWGSFNSYYPLLLICMLSSLATFIKFKETKNKNFFFISMAFAFIGFFVRETGILTVPILSTFDIVFSKNLKSRKTIIEIVKRQALFYLLVALFFFASSLYGGTPGDSADSNVKLQMRFINDRLYLEYARASILTFGKLLPPQVIPYDFVNFLRELVFRLIPLSIASTYFFPLLGWLIFVLMGLVLFFIRKSKSFFKIFLFFWIWIGLFSLFVSLAIPSTPEVLSRAYEYNTMRYRYFAFIGTSVTIAVFLSYIIKKTIVLRATVFLFVLFNLVLIWKIENDIYVTSYKPAKEFYAKFTSYFPKLPTKTVFYLYPHATALSDYILEWYTIKGVSYSNLNGQPLRVESQIIAILNKVKKKKIELTNVIFLDYSKKKGLLNDTDKVRKILLNQKIYDLKIKQTKDNMFESEPFNGPFVEIPYNLNVSMSISENGSFIGKNPDSARFRALVDYSVDRNEYLKNVKITTAYTMSQREGEPFFHVLPKNLIDGNIGPRSSWIADAWAPWVEADLGKEVHLAAVSWGSMGETRVPATYSILVSKDGKTWQKIKEVKNYSKIRAIDIFDKPVTARFVRMEIKTTSGGDFVLLDEFEAISSDGLAALAYYKDRDELFYAVTNLFQFVGSQDDINYMKDKGLDTYFAKLSWTTNKSTGANNFEYLYFPYKINTSSQNITIEIPELEIYSGAGNFLNKYFTSVSLDFGSIPFSMYPNSIQLAPRIKL